MRKNLAVASVNESAGAHSQASSLVFLMSRALNDVSDAKAAAFAACHPGVPTAGAPLAAIPLPEPDPLSFFPSFVPLDQAAQVFTQQVKRRNDRFQPEGPQIGGCCALCGCATAFPTTCLEVALRHVRPQRHLTIWNEEPNAHGRKRAGKQAQSRSLWFCIYENSRTIN